MGSFSRIEPARQTPKRLGPLGQLFGESGAAQRVNVGLVGEIEVGFDVGESDWPLKASFVLFVRDILESAVRPTLAIGSALLAIGRGLGGIELPTRRDPAPVDGAHYE